VSRLAGAAAVLKTEAGTSFFHGRLNCSGQCAAKEDNRASNSSSLEDFHVCLVLKASSKSNNQGGKDMRGRNLLVLALLTVGLGSFVGAGAASADQGLGMTVEVTVVGIQPNDEGANLGKILFCYPPTDKDSSDPEKFTTWTRNCQVRRIANGTHRWVLEGPDITRSHLIALRGGQKVADPSNVTWHCEGRGGGYYADSTDNHVFLNQQGYWQCTADYSGGAS
jgi:hypothetical protein